MGYYWNIKPLGVTDTRVHTAHRFFFINLYCVFLRKKQNRRLEKSFLSGAVLEKGSSHHSRKGIKLHAEPSFLQNEGLGFPGGTRGKESTCQSRRQKRCAFDAWVRKGQEDPLEWEMAPTPVFLSEKFHGQRNLVGYSPLVCKDLDTTEQLSTHTQRYWDRGSKLC